MFYVCITNMFIMFLCLFFYFLETCKTGLSSQIALLTSYLLHFVTTEQY